MKKISLKTLGLPYTSGELIQPTDETRSGTDYQSNGIQLPVVYFHEMNGVIAGERLGVVHQAWIPSANLDSNDIMIERGNQIIINDRRYEVVDLMYEDYSLFETHYELTLRLPNDGY